MRKADVVILEIAGDVALLHGIDDMALTWPVPLATLLVVAVEAFQVSTTDVVKVSAAALSLQASDCSQARRCPNALRASFFNLPCR